MVRMKATSPDSSASVYSPGGIAVSGRPFAITACSSTSDEALRNVPLRRVTPAIASPSAP